MNQNDNKMKTLIFIGCEILYWVACLATIVYLWKKTHSGIITVLLAVGIPLCFPFMFFLVDLQSNSFIDSLKLLFQRFRIYFAVGMGVLSVELFVYSCLI